MPVSARRAGMHTLTTAGSSAQPRHVGFSPALIDEDQTHWIEPPLEPPPLLAGFEDVGTVLLAGAERLFLYVNPMAASA